MIHASLSVLVVDDEAPPRDELCFLLKQAPEVAHVAQAADGVECLALLAAQRFDAVFLDVRMPHLDGLGLASVIQAQRTPPRVVFVTAFEEHAIEAFGLAAADYLLKPVRPERLRVTLHRLLGPHAPSASSIADRLPVIEGGHIVLIDVDDIRVAAVEQEHVVVRTGMGTYRSRLTLQELQERVGDRGFLRVHRAYLVNLRHVTAIESFFNGTYLLRLAGLDRLTIPVSRRHAQDLRSAVRL